MPPDVGNVVIFLGLALVVLLGAGVWIGIALLAAGYLGIAFLTPFPPLQALGTSSWSSLSSWTLAALPLFIWMGEILFRTRVSESMFRNLSVWVDRLPGGLIHVNVIGCGIFAAVCGSSAATTATIGRMSVPELRNRKYDEAMVIGSLAGSGTLGLLIPPSIPMIVYGVAAETSIVRLFIAGVIPGIILMMLFSGYIMVWARMHPTRTPPRGAPVRYRDRLVAIRELVPLILLIGGVIASIYAGIATATESAVFGVVGALAISWWSGTLTRASFRDSLMGATRLTCMITLIIAGAAYLTSAFAYTGVPKALAAAVTDFGVNKYALLGMLAVLYLILGCFIDGISMILLTTGVVLPAVQAAGIDLVWFGIFIIIMLEIAQITPPVGFNLFVLQGLTNRDIFYIAKVTLPFFFMMALLVVILTVFPTWVTWLPSQMLSR